ncbi:hypothetical protein ITI46_31620 [Streptomyces oryzae]|uniref:Tetratricopeptide repeat protein n=1 Tax=Streptomyces oryzae TaxID=1434886 RepID=A0ABS3XL64_9ACTN|nr:hypothetical protein [Streptomyces oryzae]
MAEYHVDWPWLLAGPDPHGDEALRGMEEAKSAADRERWLGVLSDATSSADPAAVERYAIGLAQAGRYAESLRFWRLLAEHAPDTARVLLNMASCLMSAGRLDECAHVMEECARRCRDDDPAYPVVCRRQAELDELRGRLNREQRLLEARADAYRELDSQGRASLSDLKELCRILAGLAQRPGSGVARSEVAEVAERIHAQAPDDVGGLELLGMARVLEHDQEGLAEVLRRLERVAPDSPVLAAARAQVTDPGFGERSDELKRRWDDICRRASHGEPGAEDELRRELRSHPHVEQLKVGLLFAVYGRAADGRGDYEEARRLALELAADPRAGHHTHFHVAQFLWNLGEHDQARRQFGLALATSETEEDEESVRLAARTVGAEFADPAGGTGG